MAEAPAPSHETMSSDVKAETTPSATIKSAPTVRRKPLPSTQYTGPRTIYKAPTLSSRFRTRWSMLQRRTRIFILTGIVLLLIVIIGLAAGLSTHKSSVQNLPLPSNHGGPYTGELTYYAPGLGACGVTSTDSDRIVAVSQIIFDAVQVGSNPNSNPLCGQKIRAKRVKEGGGERSVDLTVVDRCTGCQPRDLDVTIDTFGDLADIDLGRVDITWSWLTGVPGGASG